MPAILNSTGRRDCSVPQGLSTHPLAWGGPRMNSCDAKFFHGPTELGIIAYLAFQLIFTPPYLVDSKYGLLLK